MFADMARDKVTLVKKDGAVVARDFAANVSSKQVTIFQDMLPIEVGDHLLRTLPSGLVEDFVVTDPGFHQAFHGIPAHFQTKVRRGDAPMGTPQQIITHITGANAKVYNHSVDNSTNIVFHSEGDMFNRLRATIGEAVQPAEQEKLLELIERMERSQKTPAFKDDYMAFINAAAAHMTILAPFIPALTILLGGGT